MPGMSQRPVSFTKNLSYSHYRHQTYINRPFQTMALYTHARFLELLDDIHTMIMASLDDLITLRDLLVAFPSMAMPFSVSFGAVTRTILKRSSQCLCPSPYLYAIMAARSLGPLNTEQLGSFLDYHFSRKDPVHPLAIVPRNLASLEYMIDVIGALEFYLEYAIRAWDFHRSMLLNHEEKLQPPTRFRMCRALLRIQLYTELFHQPGDSSDSVSDWEERLPEMKLFWNQYERAEMVECKSIYAGIVISVDYETWYEIVEPAQNEDPIQYRGLPQLRRFMEDFSHIGRFGWSYTQRLIKQGMGGFHQVDPRDDLRLRYSPGFLLKWRQKAYRSDDDSSDGDC
jgi:hypothetical protein